MHTNVSVFHSYKSYTVEYVASLWEDIRATFLSQAMRHHLDMRRAVIAYSWCVERVCVWRGWHGCLHVAVWVGLGGCQKSSNKTEMRGEREEKKRLKKKGKKRANLWLKLFFVLREAEPENIGILSFPHSIFFLSPLFFLFFFKKNFVIINTPNQHSCHGYCHTVTLGTTLCDNSLWFLPPHKHRDYLGCDGPKVLHSDGEHQDGPLYGLLMPFPSCRLTAV